MAAASASAAARDVEAMGGPASKAEDVEVQTEEVVPAVGSTSKRSLFLELDEASSSSALKSKLKEFQLKIYK